MTNTKQIDTKSIYTTGLYNEEISVTTHEWFYNLKKEPDWKQCVYNLLISLEGVCFNYSAIMKSKCDEPTQKINLLNLDNVLCAINYGVDPSQTELYFSKEEFMQFYNEQFNTAHEDDLYETKIGSFNLGKLVEYIKLDGSLFDRLMKLETLILNNQSNGIFIKSDEYTMKDIMESITHSIVLAVSKCYVNGYMKDIVLDTNDLEKYSKYKTPEPVVHEETYLIDDVINTSAIEVVEEPKAVQQQPKTVDSGARKIKVERPKSEEKAPEETKVTETPKLQHPDIKVSHNPDVVNTKVIKGNKPQTNPEKKKETPQNVKKGIVPTDFLMPQNDKINILNTINHINNNIETTLASNWNRISNVMMTNAQLVADVNAVWGNTVANIVDMNTKCNMPIIEEVFKDFNLQLEAQIYNAISNIVNRQNMVMYIISQMDGTGTIQDIILRTFYSYIMDSFNKLTASINCYMIARGTDVNEIKVEEIVKKVNSIIPTPIDANIVTKNN